MAKKTIILCEGLRDCTFLEKLADLCGIPRYIAYHEKIKNMRHGQAQIVREFLDKIGSYENLRLLIKEEGGKSACEIAFRDILRNHREEVVLILQVDMDTVDYPEKLLKKIERKPGEARKTGNHTYVFQDRNYILFVPDDFEKQLTRHTGIDVNSQPERLSEAVDKILTMKTKIDWIVELEKILASNS